MRTPTALLTGVVLLVAAVTAAAGAGTQRAAPRLQPFGSCGALLDYAKAHASQVAGRGGVVPVAGAVSADSGRAAAPDYSTTNVQEAGIDEPDIVKTDGAHLFAVAGGKLYAVDVRAAKPRVLGSLPLDGANQQLLLRGRKLLVLASSTIALPVPAPGRGAFAPYRPTKTILSEIDVSDPSAMRVVRTLTVDGSYVTARLNDATARVVVVSTPNLPPPDAIGSTSVGSWIPHAVFQDRRTGRKTTRALVQCRAVSRPAAFSGVGMTTVLTIDLDKGLPAVDSDGVMSDARTVYASADRLYLATQRWFAVPVARDGMPPQGMTTEIHAFDISSPDRTVYRASGAVTGFLLNQWSLSAYGGNLRVASTDLPTWWDASPQRESESGVSVLAERGGALVETGRVGGLGRGERVYAVRFIGGVGYVVTFRQVDPLYTIDLADPARPRVLGALELRGYSSYLHPVGADLLLGVGQDATADGRLAGAQVELFDVSDLRRPARLDAVPLGPGSSEVEYDHHAFLYWPAKSLAVVPLQTQAVAFRVARKGIDKLARVTNPGTTPVRRSVVVGDRLFTISDQGVQASSLDTLAPVAWLPFA